MEKYQSGETLPIKIVLVTGFLGSGKTTFLNYVIANSKEHKISLILNEFGDAKIESNFIAEEGVGEITELSNGCMCCVAKSDIPRVVNYILEKSPKTEYIFIEASGLSDPDPIKDVLINGLGETTKYLANLCIIDVKNFFENKDKHPLIMSQAGEADVIILSKTQLVVSDELLKVRNFLNSLFNNTPTIDFNDSLSISKLLSFNKSASEVLMVNHHENTNKHKHEHDNYIETIIKIKETTDISIIENFFKDFKKIVRAKGFFEIGKKTYSLQYINDTLEIREVKSIRNKEGKGILLFITKVDDKEELVKTLDTLILS